MIQKESKCMGKKHQKKEPNKSNLQEQMLEQQQNGKKKSRKGSIVLCSFIGVAAILAFVLWLNRFAFYEPAEVKAFQVGEDMVYMDEVNFCILENMLDLGIDVEALQESVAEDMTADEFYKQNIMNAIMDYKVEAQMAKREGLVLTKEEKEDANKDVINPVWAAALIFAIVIKLSTACGGSPKRSVSSSNISS